MTEVTKNHGGARPGAGRKPDVNPKIYVKVRMTPEDKEIFAALGGSKWLHNTLQTYASLLKEK